MDRSRAANLVPRLGLDNRRDAVNQLVHFDSHRGRAPVGGGGRSGRTGWLARRTGLSRADSTLVRARRWAHLGQVIADSEHTTSHAATHPTSHAAHASTHAHAA